MNLKLKIDLLKLRGACVAPLTGRSGQPTECLIVPINEAGLFKGEKGVYLDLTAWEAQNPRYGDTHYLKRSLTKAQVDAMSEEDKKAQPIFGGVRPMGEPTPQPAPTAAANSTVDFLYGVLNQPADPNREIPIADPLPF